MKPIPNIALPLGKLVLSAVALPLSALLVFAASGPDASSTSTEAAPRAGSLVSLVERRSAPEPGVLTRHVKSPGWTLPLQSRVVPAPAPRRVGAPAGRLRADLDRRAGTVWVEVTGSVVNLRKGPAVSHSTLGNFRRGEQLRSLEQRGAWTQVEHAETGKVGWMHSAYLKDVAEEKSASIAGRMLAEQDDIARLMEKAGAI